MDNNGIIILRLRRLYLDWQDEKASEEVTFEWRFREFQLIKLRLGGQVVDYKEKQHENK